MWMSEGGSAADPLTKVGTATMLPARTPNDLHSAALGVRDCLWIEQGAGSVRFNLSRKAAAVVALLSITSMGLAACGEGDSESPNNAPKGEGQGPVQDPAEPTTVTFFSWVGNGPEMKKLADEFHDAHPNITIKFQNVPAEEAGQVLTTRIAGNNAP